MMDSMDDHPYWHLPNFGECEYCRYYNDKICPIHYNDIGVPDQLCWEPVDENDNN